MQHLITIGSGVVLYIFVCLLTYLVGTGLLRLLGLLRGEPSMLLLAPVIALTFWTVIVGITLGLRIPMKEIAPWLWGVSAVLALLGARRAWPAWRIESVVLFLCVILPVIVMARYFLHGLSDYIGSVAPDGWSYITVGQYVWEHQRGTQGGLAPLYQYSAQLSNTRYISYGLLAFFSPLGSSGDTQSVSSLFQAWTLFCVSCAVAFFWVTERVKPWMLIAATVLSTVSGWFANLVWANNFDNGLALTYLPSLAGLANMVDLAKWRWRILLAGLLAGMLYTYPELAPVLLASALLITLPRWTREKKFWRLWLGGSILGLGIAIVLLLPALQMLSVFAVSQFTTASATTNRPGEGIFGGLLVPRYALAAFWGLGGEHQILRLSRSRNALALVLTAIAAVGMFALLQRRKWGLAAVIALIVAGAFYFIFRQHYSYAAYKLIVIGWWCIVVALVTGADWIIAHIADRGLKRAAIFGLALVLMGFISQSNHINAETTKLYISSPNQSLSMTDFRSLYGLKAIVRDSPITVVVNDWLANNWAAYFLRDIPINLAVYRMYMAAPQYVPFLEQARSVSFETSHYILTDAMFDGSEQGTHSWKLVWSSGPYRLWDTAEGPWAAITTITNANGLEYLDGKRFFWLGKGDTSIDILASRSGLLHLRAIFVPGPSVPNLKVRRLLMATSTGYSQQLTLAGGEQNVILPVNTGKTTITLRPLDQPVNTSAPNGDRRPLILGMQGVSVYIDENPILIAKIENANGLEQSDGKQFFWLGNGSTKIQAQSMRSGQALLQATFLPGPSIPNTAPRRVLVETDTGFHEQISIAEGVQTIELPVRAGMTQIRFTPLDTPLKITLANGDKRPLVLGIKALTVQLKP